VDLSVCPTVGRASVMVIPEVTLEVTLEVILAVISSVMR
jgi:hypothetical protein